ncbi:MAG TPA: FIST N-terminal domain-containing protein [Anaeromyxobacter sp.]|nr:FIST N-terminal domain-containing protein [Anaeromyxobacter sp.]
MAQQEPCIEVGRGIRREPLGRDAGAAAAEEALRPIRIHRPSAVLVFASPRQDLSGVATGVRQVVGEVPIVGASSAGEICDGLHDGSVVVTVLASPYLRVRCGVGEDVSRSWEIAVDRALGAPGLRDYFDASLAAWPRLTREGKEAFALVLSPGPTERAESRGFPIVEMVKRRALGKLPIFGMSASDELRFERNFVLAGGRAVADGLVVAVFETQLRFGIAVAHGMRATGPALKVTAVEEDEVLEFDGRPAADVYAELVHAPRSSLEGVFVAGATRSVLGVPGPLGSYIPNAATRVTQRSGIRFAIPVSSGQVLYRLEPTSETASRAGREAVAKAMARAGTTRPALAVVASCALRPALLGGTSAAEVTSMAGPLGGAPLVGLVSCGEAGLADDGVPQHLNAVIGALVFGEELSQAAHMAEEMAELRRSTEELRRRTRDELERLVAERTARLEAEIDERRRLQRAWRTLSECNKAMVRAVSEEGLFAEICRILVESGGHRMCWVGLAEPDGSVRPVASAGHGAAFATKVRASWQEDDERGRGPVGTAIRSGQPVVVRNLLSSDRAAPWCEEAVRRGLTSMIALPLTTEGRPFAALAIYDSDAGALDEKELALLTDLSGDVAFGVMGLRARSERAAMTARLTQADRLVAMGTLAAGVGHEINNPLSYAAAGTHALAELIERGFADPAASREAQGILREVNQGLERIRHAVRDLKLFSRGDDDTRRPVDVQAVLESTLHMAYNDIRHRARLVRDYHPIPLVAASESRLGQVFLNLVVNASQSIPDGAAEENEIRVATRTDEDGWAVVEIRDTGAGISREDLARIFDPFFTTKPLGEGTGLGLAICRNIVASTGGDITVESQRGQGSVFRVRLPGVVPGVAEAEPSPGPAPRVHGGRVLVVDDDPLVARSMRRMLAREHEVLVETSSREALDRFRAGERFDVVLCDVMMPQVSGPEFHAELSRLAPDQARRVVFVTGGAFTAGSARYLEEAGNRTLEKPFDAEVLRALVREFVGGSP